MVGAARKRMNDGVLVEGASEEVCAILVRGNAMLHGSGTDLRNSEYSRSWGFRTVRLRTATAESSAVDEIIGMSGGNMIPRTKRSHREASLNVVPLSHGVSDPLILRESVIDRPGHSRGLG